MDAHVRVRELPAGPSGAANEAWARIDPTVYVTAGRRLQARAMGEAIAAGWRGTTRLVRQHLLGPIERRRGRRRAVANLAALDDRLLADIGLRRGDIELAVDGRLADPRVLRRAPAATPAVADRLRRGERVGTSPVTANSNRSAPGLAA